MGWDDLVIDAACDRYGLDRAVTALPRAEAPGKAQAAASEKKAKEKSFEQFSFYYFPIFAAFLTSNKKSSRLKAAFLTMAAT